MKRVINKKLLKEWIRSNGRGSLELLAYKSGCSASLIQKLCCDSYDGMPSIEKIDGICSVTGYQMCDLFPLVDQNEEKETA